MIADIAELATAVGVFLAVFSLQEAKRQRQRDFEDFYVRRYWRIMDRLSLEAVRGAPPPDGAVEPHDERIIRQYLILCEDELDLYVNRYISKETWQVWGPGMKQQLERWPYASVWAEAKAASLRGEERPFALLSKLMAGDELLRKSWWTVRRGR